MARWRRRHSAICLRSVRSTAQSGVAIILSNAGRNPAIQQAKRGRLARWAAREADARRLSAKGIIWSPPVLQLSWANGSGHLVIIADGYSVISRGELRHLLRQS